MSVAAFAVAAVLVAVSADPALADKRVALVIGNSRYQNVPQLPNPARDAQAIFEKFKAAGFEVDKAYVDLSYLDFGRVLDAFADKARDADVAVIFFAGHGVELDNKNYVIPVDAKPVSQRDAKRESIPMADLSDAVNRANKLRLIILDACRDNPFANLDDRLARGESRIITRGFARMDEAKAYTLVVYAAAPGTAAEDGNGAHSPFTQALLDKFFEPGVGVQAAFGRVRDEVQRITRGRQTPYLNGSPGEEDIALVPGKPKPAPGVATAPPNQSQEYNEYQVAMGVNEEQTWLAFLRRYPDEGDFFHGAAQGMLRKLQGAKPPATEQPKKPDEPKVAILEPPLRPKAPEPATPEDEREWGRLNQSDPDQLRDFIRRYQNSPKALIAQDKLKALEEVAQERDWDKIKNGNDQAAFQEFIQKHRDSRHVAEAQSHLKQLQVEADDREWDKIKGTGDPRELEQFKKDHPSSPHVKEANERVKLLGQIAEDAAWGKAQNSFDAAALADFVSRFPNSSHAAEARKRLTTVQAAEGEWDKLKNSSNQADLQGFIKRNQNLPRAKDAQARLDAVVADNAKREWEPLKNSSNQKALQQFIDQYPNSPQAKEAFNRLEGVRKDEEQARLKAEQEKAQAAAKQQAEQAQKKAEQEKAQQEAARKAELDKEAKQVWATTNKNDARAVKKFAEAYPDSSVRPEAEKKLVEIQKAEEEAWNKASRKSPDQVALLQGFMDRYPESPRRPEAESLLGPAKLEAAQKADDDAWNKLNKNKSNLQDFIARNQSSRHLADANLLLKNIATVEAAQAWGKIRNSTDAGVLQKYIDDYPDSPNIADAKQRLDDVKNNKFASLPANTPELITEAQKALKGLNCYSGRIDGKLVEPTKNAVREYRLHQGAGAATDAEAEITDSLVKELEDPNASRCPPNVAKQEEKPAEPKHEPPVQPRARQVAGPPQRPERPATPPPALKPTTPAPTGHTVTGTGF
jgi:outer membrane protein assembly factor BamD (BamD/ComL family)